MGSAERQRVDVGVVTWNSREVTVDALRRLVGLDHGVELRLLVHDNGSADGTPDAIARAIPEAEVVASPENLGFAAGMNRLLDRADAPWFFALNSDAWPQPGAITALVDLARRHPRAAAVAPLLRRPDGSVEHSTHCFPSPSREWAVALGLASLAGGRLGRHFLMEGHWKQDRPRPVPWAVGAALLMRRSAIDHAGGFDERFFMYVEDMDWCWRAGQRGWDIWFTPDATVTHIGNVSGERMYGVDRTRRWMHQSLDWHRRRSSPLSAQAVRAAHVALGLRLAATRNADARHAWLRHASAALTWRSGRPGAD